MDRKIAHHVFDVMQTSHIWIEQHDNHYAVVTSSDMMGNSAPTVVGVFDKLIYVRANLDAILTMLAPNIVEGSVRDVSEFDKP